MGCYGFVKATPTAYSAFRRFFASGFNVQPL